MGVLREGFDGPVLNFWTWDLAPASGFTVDGKLNISLTAASQTRLFKATNFDLALGDELRVKTDFPVIAPGAALDHQYNIIYRLTWADATDAAAPPFVLTMSFYSKAAGNWGADILTTGNTGVGYVTSMPNFNAAGTLPWWRVRFTDELFLVDRSADAETWIVAGAGITNKLSLEYPADLEIIASTGASGSFAVPMTIPVDDLLLGDPEDPGFYFLGLHPANAGVSGGLLLQASPPAGEGEGLALLRAAFDMETGIVEDGILTDTPEIGASARSVAGVGAYEYDDQVLDPVGLLTGAAGRWLASAATYTPGVAWYPVEGDGSLHWATDPAHAPGLDADYVYGHARGELYRSALVFDGSAWMQLSTSGLATTTVTVVVVAVLGPGQGGEYGVIESPGSGAAAEDADAGVVLTGFGLRYNHGRTIVWAGAPVLGYDGQQEPLRPTVLALTVDTVSGRLLVIDRERSSRTFATEGLGTYDLGLMLGRIGQGTDASTNAVMDVLEIDLFDRALSFGELDELVADLCAAYGVL